jgi:hypothetical protein
MSKEYFVESFKIKVSIFEAAGAVAKISSSKTKLPEPS